MSLVISDVNVPNSRMDIQTINRKIAELKREKARYKCTSASAQELRQCADIMINVFEGIRKNMVAAAEEAEKVIEELRVMNADQSEFNHL